LRDASRRRLSRPATGLLVLAVLAALAAMGAGPAPPDIDAAEYEKATRALLCDCGCHPQSIRDCACGRADELAHQIAGMIRGGMSGDEVIEDFVARKGEQIRVAPVARGFNLVAWLGPALLLVAAAVALTFVLRRWRRAAPAEGPRETAPEIAPDDPYLAKLRKDLERYP
jgi:cytochrome c-type biogenesis protein CcmH